MLLEQEGFKLAGIVIDQQNLQVVEEPCCL
jgi:hypothetical protein